VLSESAARWVLVLHTIVGVAAVGAATHLVIWLRRYLRGEHGRRRAVIRFAWLVLGLQLAAFGAGSVMYPTYKVEVRTAYLEDPTAVGADGANHDKALGRIAARTGDPPPVGTATAELVRRAARAARWFDVKENWIVLGMLMSAALVLVLSLWDPRDAPVISPIVTTLAVIVAGTVWLGAIIGVVTASWRAV
jgi:hypothetical protein